MKKLHFLLCFFFAISFSGIVQAQNSSNKGKDFYVAYSGHIDGTISRLTLFLSADQNTTYEVFVGPNLVSSGSIAPNTCLPVVIDSTLPNQNAYIGSSNVIEKNKAIRVITNNPISLYSIISNSARTGGTLILPTNTLGKEYYAYCFQNKGTSASYAQITIVATEDDTEVEITPTAIERFGAYPAGQTFKIPQKLMKGAIYQYQSANNGDLSGSLVRSINGCKPIAVFTGNTWAAFCEEGNTTVPSGGDNLYQQMFPVASWGKKFVTAPTFNSLNGSVEAFRIIVANDNTTVTINGSTTSANGTPLANPYVKGSVITFYANGPNVISATGPISVAQYQTSQTCNPGNRNSLSYPGDPEITLLNPIEQTLSNITVFSRLADVGVATRVVNYYLNVIIKTADVSSFRMDGSAVGNFIPIANGEYSYAIIDVTDLQAQHQLTAAGGFSAMAYGLGNVESYAYLAGANVQDFTFQPLSAVTQQAITSGCLGEPINLQINLPYKATSLEWFIQGQPPSGVIVNPQESGTVVKDQVTYYTYTYANQLQYNNAGTYQFRVIAEKPTADQCGNKEDLSVEFTVDSQPTAAFEPLLTTCQGSTVQFKDISTSNSPGRNIATWLWDFGDGTTSTEQHPTHVYQQPGTFNVVLTVYTNTKCGITSMPQSILIDPKPVASFQKVGDFCVDKEIVLTNNSSIASGTITNYHWDFGDGSTPVDLTVATPPIFKYTTAGTKTITLTVTSDQGCISDVFSLNVEVNDLPIADFSMPGYCLNDGIATFKNLSTNADGTTTGLTYIWEFGDSFSTDPPSTLVDGKHQYSQTGPYQVKLRVFNQFGCEGLAKVQTFIVNPFVTAADFTVDNETNLCSGTAVVIHNTSTITPPGRITKIEVYKDFGNDPTSFITIDYPGSEDILLDYPVFGGQAPRTFQIRFVAYSGESCFKEITKTINIKPIPILKFDAIPNICEKDGDVFITQASETSGIIGKGIYSGVGITSPTGTFNPIISGTGTFTITYTFVGDEEGACPQSITQDITVQESPRASSDSKVYVLAGGEVMLSPTVEGLPLTYQWSPALGLNRSDILNPMASPAKDTEYTLTVTNLLGCSASTKIKVIVLENIEVPSSFSPNGDNINDIWNIKYLDTYPKATVEIYTRNGTKVFSSFGYKSPFDGNFQNQPLPVGVYYYIINPRNGRKAVTGSVTLIR